jgi:hypothetical protein
MKFIRIPLTALALAIPAAAVLVSAPAAAQHAVVVTGPAIALPAPTIERFVLRTDGRVDPGEPLRFRLVGAAGGRAWVDIPGVVSGVPLTEIRPGVYEGAYVVRWRDNARQFDDAVATLERGRGRATALVDVRGNDQAWRDHRGPLVTDYAPAHGSRVDAQGRTRISARIQDDRSGAVMESVRLRVDGRDVTSFARIEGDEVRYREDLRPGRHTAEITVRDRAGNETRRAWYFDVVGYDRYGRAEPFSQRSYAAY